MAKQFSQICGVVSVRLTPVGTEYPTGIDVLTSHLLTYSQQAGFTRLRLLGQKTLDVTETVERIDYIIRTAASA